MAWCWDIELSPGAQIFPLGQRVAAWVYGALVRRHWRPRTDFCGFMGAPSLKGVAPRLSANGPPPCVKRASAIISPKGGISTPQILTSSGCLILCRFGQGSPTHVGNLSGYLKRPHLLQNPNAISPALPQIQGQYSSTMVSNLVGTMAKSYSCFHKKAAIPTSWELNGPALSS